MAESELTPRNAMVLGFQLFCVLVNAFSPSIRFEPFVRDFLARHIEQNIKGIGIMALCMSLSPLMDRATTSTR